MIQYNILLWSLNHIKEQRDEHVQDRVMGTEEQEVDLECEEEEALVRWGGEGQRRQETDGGKVIAILQ